MGPRAISQDLLALSAGSVCRDASAWIPMRKMKIIFIVLNGKYSLKNDVFFTVRFRTEKKAWTIFQLAQLKSSNHVNVIPETDAEYPGGDGSSGPPDPTVVRILEE